MFNELDAMVGNPEELLRELGRCEICDKDIPVLAIALGRKDMRDVLNAHSYISVESGYEVYHWIAAADAAGCVAYFEQEYSANHGHRDYVQLLEIKEK